MKRLAAYQQKIKGLVDDRFAELCRTDDPRREKPYRAMDYTLRAEGKRLRPLLFFAACEVCGGKPEPFLDAACAIELVHTASLVLDDLPAMDDAKLRRGRPTLHTVYDEATAVLAAVAELMAAFELLAECPGLRRGKLSRLLSAELAEAVGRDWMISGQQLDLDCVGKRLTMEELEFIHAAKTGALFISSARMGCLCAGAGKLETESLTAYAKNLGLAFQIADDILDVSASVDELGKDVGKDEDKPTFVHLFGLEASRRVAEELIETSRGALAAFNRDTTVLDELASYVLVRRK